ncbi:MAG: S41 family peptidase [Candidatus Xenobia bacterium]
MLPRSARFLALLLMLMLPARAFAAPAVATTAPVHDDGIASIQRVMSLVKVEFLQPVGDAKLANGAIAGMRHYLQDHKMNAAFLVDVSKGLETHTLTQDFTSVLSRYPSVSPHRLTEAAIRGLMESLKDPYTVYMDAKDYAGLMEQMQGGNFGGLGVYIESDAKHDNRLVVVEPMDGSPAEQAGMKAGDVIMDIDGVSTRGMTLDDATKRLRGDEGSKVTLTMQRGSAAPYNLTLTRARIQMKTVRYKVLDDGIGYVKLRVFGENTGAELDEAFRAFDAAHVKGYILDLRNNGGGYISTALEVCSHFLPTGSRVVSVVERGSPEAVYSSLPNVRPVLPLVVLVNHFSASASEITAGCIKDLKAGTLIGTKTFGKGSVQKIFPLPDGSAVKITTAHYHTPDGHDIHTIGINPDQVVDMDPRAMGSSSDVQMAKARQVLETAIAHEPASTVATATGEAVPSAIPIDDPNQEYDWIATHPCDEDGGTWLITDQSTVEQDGHWYDELKVKCPKDGTTRTFVFDVTHVLSR